MVLLHTHTRQTKPNYLCNYHHTAFQTFFSFTSSPWRECPCVKSMSNLNVNRILDYSPRSLAPLSLTYSSVQNASPHMNTSEPQKCPALSLKCLFFIQPQSVPATYNGGDLDTVADARVNYVSANGHRAVQLNASPRLIQ